MEKRGKEFRRSPSFRVSPETVIALMLLLFGATANAQPGGLPGTVYDTEPVIIHSEDPERSALLDETAMLLDFGSTPASKYFAARKQARNVEVLWDGASSLLVEHNEDETGLFELRDMDIVTLERHIRLYPADTQALMIYAVRLYQTNQIERSLIVFEKAWEADPTGEQAAELYSGVLVRAGNPARAVTRIRTLLDRLPDNRVVRFNAACALALSGANEEAMYQLSILARLDWDELAYYMGDKDLTRLHDNPEFVNLTDALLQQTRIRLNNLLVNTALRPSI